MAITVKTESGVLLRYASWFFDILFAYPTPKVVRIRITRIGAMFRLAQLSIIAYIIGYVIIWKQGYQEKDFLQSSVVTKIKGVMRTNKPLHSRDGPIWDSVDVIIPPQENNAFFITTNALVTPNQIQGNCSEVQPISDDPDLGITGLICKEHKDCEAGTSTRNGNGYRSGTCNNTTGTCEVTAWCPVELDKLPDPPTLSGSENFTVLVKNNIRFPKFGVKRRNILGHMTKEYLGHCQYNKVTDPYCPIFAVKYMLTAAGETFEDMSVRGGIMAFEITWDCNLDWSLDHCLPKYSFRRMDDKQDVVGKGWNFRYASHWSDDSGIQHRDLVKAYGIRFVFNVYGVARQFSAVDLLLKLGAGLGLLGLATILCDFILLNCLKNRQTFQDFKFQKLEQDALPNRKVRSNSAEVPAQRNRPRFNSLEVQMNKYPDAGSTPCVSKPFVIEMEKQNGSSINGYSSVGL